MLLYRFCLEIHSERSFESWCSTIESMKPPGPPFTMRCSFTLRFSKRAWACFQIRMSHPAGASPAQRLAEEMDPSTEVVGDLRTTGVGREPLELRLEGLRDPLVGVELEHPLGLDGDHVERPVPLRPVVLEPVLDDPHVLAGRARQGDLHGAIHAEGVDHEDRGGPALD
jgi:hypothetical protein